MALPTAPVAEWTDEAVLGFAVGKRDHALLRIADYNVQDYEKARIGFKAIWARSSPETAERAKQAFLLAKRALLAKLLELRAAPGKAQSGQLRTASAVIKMTSDDAAKVVDKMMTTMTKATDKMAKLKRKHDKLMVQQADASDRVDTVADYVEAGDTIDVGEQTGADNNGLTEDRRGWGSHTSEGFLGIVIL